MKLRHSLALATGPLAVVLGLALAATPARCAGVTAAPPRHIVPSPMAGGMVIGIDPETGRLVMPEPAQLERLLAARQARITSSRPAPVRRADGSLSLDVRGWMRDYAYIRIGADGRPVLGCADGQESLVRATQAPAPRPALEER